MKNFARVLISCMTLMLAQLAMADMASGYQWLEQQQQNDGAIYGQNEKALKYQTTQEAFSASSAFDRAGAVNYFLTNSIDDTEFKARQVIVSNELLDKQTLLADVMARQNGDGGFGHLSGYGSSNYDTYWALAGILDASVAGTSASKALGYLMAQQNSDGGWSYPESFSSVMLTARITQVLVQVRYQYPAVQDTLNRAIGYLLANVSLDASLAQRALVLKALSVSNASLDVTSSLAQNLLDAQSLDGSWEQSIYSTALALQALKAYERSTVAASSETGIGSIAGKVVTAGSSQPLTNVTVALVNDDSKMAITDDQGQFTLIKLPLGSHTLLFSKPGYYSQTQSVSLSSGTTFRLPDVALQQASSEAVFQGRIYDDVSGQAIANAQLTLTGPQHYSMTTRDNGSFYLAGMPGGTYQLTIEADNYRALNATVTLSAGIINQLNQGLVSSSTVLTDIPVDVTGRVVDGDNGQVIAGVQMSIENVSATVTDTLGQFSLPSIERGEYQLHLSIAGYNLTTVTFTLPAGASGNLGDIRLYKSLDNAPPANLTLNFVVRDAVTKELIPQAQVMLADASPITQVIDESLGGVVPASSWTALSSSAGIATFSALTALNFTLSVEKEGYLPQNGSITVNGYGEMTVEVGLTPVTDTPASSITLTGLVNDESGNPVGGARLRAGDIEVTAAADGTFTLENIDTLSFLLSVSAEGFENQVMSFSLQAYGHYSTVVVLQPVSVSARYNILDVITPVDAVPAHDIAAMQVNIQSLEPDLDEVVVRARLFDLQDQYIDGAQVYFPGALMTEARFQFEAGQTLTLNVDWNVMQSAPGTYRVQVDVVEPGTILRADPEGQILASRSALLQVAGKSSIEGHLQLEPPLIQAGSQDDVELKALIQNTGNEVIPAGIYNLTIVTENATVLHTATIEVGEMAINQLIELDFGVWLPTTPGHHKVFIERGDDDNLFVNGTIYVGEVATGSFALAQQVFPEGDQSTSANIHLQGVDITQATVTDALFEQVKTAVLKGGNYAGVEAIAWDKSQNCLGCHIQSQSVFGMSAAEDFVNLNKGNLHYLVNTLTTSAKNGGEVRDHYTTYLKTQTAFALWALSERKQKQYSFETAYDAASFMDSKKTTVSTGVYWTNDHVSGWFNTAQGITWAVAKGYSDVIAASELPEVQAMKTFTWSAANKIDLSGNELLKLTASNDGQSLYIARSTQLVKFDTVTNTSTAIYSTAAVVNDVVEYQDSVYLLDGYTLVRLNSDGSKTQWTQTLKVVDLEVFNGQIYGIDTTANAIVKFNFNTNLFEKVKSGSPINQLKALTRSHDGNYLIVANYAAKNILKMDASHNLSVLFDGLGAGPVSIDAIDNGEYLITTLDSYYAVNIAHIDGTVERLFDNSNATCCDYRAFAPVNGKVYTTLRASNDLYWMERSFKPAPKIDQFKSTLRSVANYYKNSGNLAVPTEITGMAFQLMVLAETRPYVTDSAVLTAIDTSITKLTNNIRLYQRTDGGWGRNKTSASDPLATAIMGLALDYTNPSADDPAVRKAIAYLLNKQAANGSWTGSFYTTRLGVTGAVMAYLPRALQRLGGLDIGVNLSLPANIELSNPNLAPDSVSPQANGETLYTWSLDGVTSNAQDLDFTLMFRDLLVDEIRPAASLATMHFANSFNGEQLMVPLNIPEVTAVTNIGLLMNTDKLFYSANEPVQINNLVSNIGPEFADGLLTVEIREATFSTLIENLTPDTPVSLATNETMTVLKAWNTGVHPAGNYVAYAKVTDQSGHTQVEVSKPFMIVPSGGVTDDSAVRYSTSVSTDRYDYQPYDVVALSTRVRNQVYNATNEAVLAKLEVTDPSGAVIYATQYVARQMAPNGQQDFAGQLLLQDMPSGVYNVTVTLWNASVTEQIASAATTFRVSDSEIGRIQGNVAVNKAEISPGESLTCADTVLNLSSTTSANVTLERLVVNLDSNITVQEEQQAVVLDPNANWINGRDVATAQLEEGNYACVLIARQDDAVTTLGYASFKVLIKVAMETEVTTGNQGRWLILLDPSGSDTGTEHSLVAAQDAYLRALLDSAGWSYTIVYTGDDFARELYTGQYVAYGLLAEKVGLDPKVEQILAEVVYQGEGLLVSGVMNRRDNHLEKALGIGITGQELKATAVEIPAGTLPEQTDALTLQPSIKLDIDRCDADIVASYVGVTKAASSNGNKPHSACPDDSRQEAAVVSHAYGDGKSLFIAFDALDEATVEGSLGNAYARLILHAMTTVHPQNLPMARHDGIPLVFTVTNTGVPVEARVKVALVPDILVLEAGAWQTEEVDGQAWLVNSFMLDEDAVWSDLLYLQVGSGQETHLPMMIDYRLPGTVDWSPYATQEVIVPATMNGDTTLQEAITQLQAIANDKAVTQALKKLQAAQSYWQQGLYTDAINQFLLALDLLGETRPVLRDQVSEALLLQLASL